MSSTRIIGTLRDLSDGRGAVRMEDVYDTDIDDLWSALTVPRRLARWIAQVDGDPRLGVTVHARFTSAWEGPCRVDVCDPPHHLLVTLNPEAPDETVIEADLAAEGAQTRLIIEERGIPLGELPYHGAGWQAHVEDLAAHVGERDAADWTARWKALTPAYQEMTVEPATTTPANEREALLGFLAAQRRSVLAIVDGLDERDLRRSVVPSGWTPLGLIEHLGHAERFWFEKTIGGFTDAGGDEPSATTGSTQDVLAVYRSRVARSEEILAGRALDARPDGVVQPGMAHEIRTVRDIVLHMIEEIARHAGHLDIARELLDGKTGLGPR